VLQNCGSLVEVFVLTVACPTHLVHGTPSTPSGTSNPQSFCCASGGTYATRLVTAIVRDDAGEGSEGGPYDGVSLGAGLLCPELEKRYRPQPKSTNDSWQVETYISVKGKWKYLYHA